MRKTDDISKYFSKSSLIPAIVQEVATKEVLMLAYMNEESLTKTLETGYTWFFSRSRNELWNKGATSGHLQKVIKISGDCDDDTLLIEVEQTGPACHTGNKSCFYQVGQVADFEEPYEKTEGRDNKFGTYISNSNALKELFEVVCSRKAEKAENSYTCYLFEKGLDKILKKCGEECSEAIIAAKNLQKASNLEEKKEAAEETKNEICDLLYHLMVLLVDRGLAFEDIEEILNSRSQKIGNLKNFHETDKSS